MTPLLCVRSGDHLGYSKMSKKDTLFRRIEVFNESPQTDTVFAELKLRRRANLQNVASKFLIFPHNSITIFENVVVILPRFCFSNFKDHLSPWKKMKKLRHHFVAMNLMSKCAKFHVASPSECRLKFNPARAIELSEMANFVYNFVQKTYTSEELWLRTIWPTFPFDFFLWFSHKMSLYFFYTIMQKVRNDQKLKWGGGGGGGVSPALIDEHCCPRKTQTCECKCS